jgi:hypothetical protein
MHIIFLIIFFLCFLLACRFMPFTSLAVLILAGGKEKSLAGARFCHFAMGL